MKWLSVRLQYLYPDGKVHGAKMGPTWVLSAPDGSHVDPMNLIAIRVVLMTICHRRIKTEVISQNFPQSFLHAQLTWEQKTWNLSSKDIPLSWEHMHALLEF